MRALLKKEWLEMFRDRRALFATFGYPFFGPVLLYFVFNAIITDVFSDEALKVDVVGASDSSPLVHFLENNNVAVSRKQSVDRLALEEKNTDLVIEIDRSDDEHPALNVYINPIGNKRAAQSRRAQGLVQVYQRKLAQSWYLQQGTTPLYQPFAIHIREISLQSEGSQRLLEGFLIFFLLAPFVCSLSVANDSTAGERERGSLLPLLAQPISRWQITLAKWLTASAIGIVGTMLTIILGVIVLEQLPLHKLDIAISASLTDWLLTALLMVPVVAMVSALQMLVAMFAKSYKEGLTYINMLMFLPMAAVYIGPLIFKNNEGLYFPLLGQQQIMRDLFAGHTLGVMDFLPSTLATLAVCAVAIACVRALLNSERILK